MLHLYRPLSDPLLIDYKMVLATDVDDATDADDQNNSPAHLSKARLSWEWANTDLITSSLGWEAKQANVALITPYGASATCVTTALAPLVDVKIASCTGTRGSKWAQLLTNGRGKQIVLSLLILHIIMQKLRNKVA